MRRHPRRRVRGADLRGVTRLGAACPVPHPGYGAVWQRASFGTRRSWVRIPLSRRRLRPDAISILETWQSGECSALLRRSRQMPAAGSSPAVSAPASHTVELAVAPHLGVMRAQVHLPRRFPRIPDPRVRAHRGITLRRSETIPIRLAVGHRGRGQKWSSLARQGPYIAVLIA